jgi:hypothetical protein
VLIQQCSYSARVSQTSVEPAQAEKKFAFGLAKAETAVVSLQFVSAEDERSGGENY